MVSWLQQNVSASYAYIFYTKSSGRLRCNFWFVEPASWDGVDSQQKNWLWVGGWTDVRSFCVTVGVLSSLEGTAHYMHNRKWRM